jgi:hypothetical protein
VYSKLNNNKRARHLFEIFNLKNVEKENVACCKFDSVLYNNTFGNLLFIAISEIVTFDTIQFNFFLLFSVH